MCASAIGTDSLAIARRHHKLTLDGAAISSHKAYQQGRVGPQDIDIFELHDAYTIITALSSAAGFAKPGEGVHFGKQGEIALDGIPHFDYGRFEGTRPSGRCDWRVSVCGNVPATHGDSWSEPDQRPPHCSIQNIGGTGATVVSHILKLAA